ncbi:MAG: TonB family protein [Erythrobacter sp.]
MTYLSQSHANRPAAIAGVAGVHLGLGALIVVGLTVTGSLPDVYSGPLPTTEYRDPPPPPPKPAKQPEAAPNSVVYTPPVPDFLPPTPNIIDTTPILPPMSDDIRLVIDPPSTNPGIGSGSGSNFQPTQVSPRNDPSRWLTDNDYRSIWIRKEMFGTASFMLEVGANGRVTNCSITKSTGHNALDQATCKLVAKRARFTPASDALGKPTQGAYSSSIRWVLPD